MDSKHNGHVTETPDVSYIKNVDVTHEKSDVQTGGVAKFLIGLLILTIATCVLVWGMFVSFQSRVKEPARAPLALAGKERLPPEPRLQAAPGFGEQLEKNQKAGNEAAKPVNADQPKDALWEIKELRKQWNDVLENGPVDKDGKRYGMPIENAKEEIIRSGLPTRSGVK